MFGCIFVEGQKGKERWNSNWNTDDASDPEARLVCACKGSSGCISASCSCSSQAGATIRTGWALSLEQPRSLRTMKFIASCSLQILFMPFVMNLKWYPTFKTMVMMMPKRWLCGQEHWLPSQRTQVQFLHLHGDSPLSCNSNCRESAFF